MTEQFEQIRETRRELSRLRRRAATLRAIAARQRRQTKVDHWAGGAVRRSDEARRGRAADRRHRAAQARQIARTSGQQDPDERQRLADLRELEADERDRLADLREQRANERERLADERDRLAYERDLAADHRDLVADRREVAADRRDQVAFYYYVRSFRLEGKLVRPVPVDDRAEAPTDTVLTPTTTNGSHAAPAPGDSDSRVGSGTSRSNGERAVAPLTSNGDQPQAVPLRG